MQKLAVAVVVLSVSVMAQTAPVPSMQAAGPLPRALQGATAETIAVPESALQEMAVSEPDISARDEAPQPGAVRLMVLVSRTGTVEEAAVVEGEPELARVALAGVKH